MVGSTPLKRLCDIKRISGKEGHPPHKLNLKGMKKKDPLKGEKGPGTSGRVKQAP